MVLEVFQGSCTFLSALRVQLAHGLCVIMEKASAFISVGELFMPQNVNVAEEGSFIVEGFVSGTVKPFYNGLPKGIEAS